MKRIAQQQGKMGKITILTILLSGFVLISQTGCATATKVGEKGSGVITSREATEIWHSYEIRPDYNYYYYGPDSQPNYIIGIDKKYRLTSKMWKPVELTPEMLKNWFNYIRPRVGYSQSPYGAFIMGPNDEPVGLWYSVKDWRATGAATVGEDNTISVTAPALPRAGGSMRRKRY